MKRNSFAKMAAVLGLTGIMVLSSGAAVMASAEKASPSIARSKAWDNVAFSLGVPKSVQKVVCADCVFYLAPGVNDADFAAVIAAGPEAVAMHTFNNGPLYYTSSYVLWNGDKTTLIVHPLDFLSEIELLEAVAIPTDLSADLIAEAESSAENKPAAFTPDERQTYMLSAEYVNEVRNEFYRILNEYRAGNGLRELEVNLELQNYADLRASEQRDLFSHTRPNGTPAGSGWHNSKNTINTRYAENIISCGAIGAEPLSQADFILNKWKNSPGHNAHMLYDFDPEITMAFGFFPEIDEHGFASSGVVFATGY